MQSILITAGTTSLALKVKNILANKFDITLGTSGDIPSILKNTYIQLPKENTIGYIHEILKIALDNNFNYILPLTVAEAYILSKNLIIFEEYDIKILLTEPAVMEELMTIDNPSNTMPLVLLENGVDLISGKKTNSAWTGLGVLSDEESDFAIVLL